MATPEKIRLEVVKILGAPNSVKFEDIQWVMNQLGAKSRKAKHGVLFKISGRKLMVNNHNDGRATIPRYCVDDFERLMTELGLVEDV